MLFINKIRSYLWSHFAEMSWQGVFSLSFFYVFSSWLFLSLLGESELSDPSLFFYWLMVTASTVGYGDYSPTTFEGRMLVSFYIIPFGLSMFALVVGQVVAALADQWQRGIRGMKAVNFDQHILVIGWQGQSTMKMIQLLKQEADEKERRQIVLCVDQEMQNPMPDEAKFIRVESYNIDSQMQRANLQQAAIVIINTRSDDLTFTTTLYCQKRNQNAHMIARFEDEQLGELLTEHCPSVEVTPSLSIEMIVKAAMDKGSSQLHKSLLSIETVMTQYSLKYTGATVEFKVLFNQFKEQHNATLIAVQNPNSQQIINPDNVFEVEANAQLYYIADQRLKI